MKKRISKQQYDALPESDKSRFRRMDLDEQFAPAGVEDIDYSLRLLLNGYKLIQVPEGETVDRRTDVSTGSFPIVHMGNASYGKEEGWHDVLRRNNELLKEKYPNHFKGLEWLAVDYASLKKKMKELDQQVYYELFEVDVYKVLASEVKGKTIIDVGGNKGFFSILCMEMGAKECHCFEPVPSIYEEMQGFIKDIPEIHSYNLAVLDGSVSEVHMKEDSWCSTIWGDLSSVPVPCISLIEAMKCAEGDDLILKLDCEGSEYEILFNTPPDELRKFSAIYLEIHDLPNPNYLGQGKRLLDYVAGLGFEVIHGPKPGTWFDDLFVPSPITMYKLLRQPKVNIIISTYQRHALLREALDSVRAQTYQNINVLVVADGKDEEVERIVSEYPNATYYDIPHDGNIGSKAKIHGIEQVSEGYVCFLDDDNVLLPDYAETLVNAIEPEKDVVIGQVLMHGTEDGKELIRTLPPDDSFPTWRNIDTLNYLVEHRIAKLCKDKWIQEGEWIDQDFKFINECLKHTDYAFVPRILAHHREVKPKVWDIFPYYTEGDILEIRLNELDSVVDKFLVVEANRTHSGKPKPYYLSENLDRFAKWKDKIVIHKVDLANIDFSQYDFDPTWVREHLQRDAARQVLQPCDFIIVGDVDEIPRASVVREYIESKPDKVGVLVQSRYMYHLNYKCVETDEPQLNSKILPYRMLGNYSLNDIRFADKENLLPTVRLESAGWHFTFAGGLKAVTQKVRAWAHQEIGERLRDDEIANRVETGKDIYDSANSEWELVSIDNTFPQYVQDNQRELEAKGLIKPLQNRVIVPGIPTLSDKKRWTVTAEISTKDRYETTLPMAIAAVATQTRKPDKLKIYDDGDQLDLRNLPPFDSLLKMLDEIGIEWEVLATPRKGQVTNHQHCLDYADTDLLWRVDDDQIPMPDCLERLVNTIRDYGRGGDFDTIGAVAGLVHHPGNVSPLPDFVDGSLKDVHAGLNMQWFSFNHEVKEVEHLYSTFLLRVAAARMAGGYPKGLSRIGHREETLMTMMLRRAGFKLLVTPYAKTYHLQAPTGGIRSFHDHSLWEKDEQVFQSYLKEWGEDDSTPTKIVIIDAGIGDHLLARGVWDQIRKRHPDKEFTIALCYPEVFADVPNVRIISIAEAKLMIGDRYPDYSLYKFCWDRDWDRPLAEAMVEFWGAA